MISLILIWISVCLSDLSTVHIDMRFLAEEYVKMNLDQLLTDIMKANLKPSLFEPGEALFWDDPHISQSMLQAHLDPAHDLASRKPETIDRIVERLLRSGMIKPGFRLLDLGCGPGLYAERFSRAGVKVVGLDISQRSLDYASEQAQKAGLEIEYRCRDFLTMDYHEEFDAVMQIYGELNVFPDEKRDLLLSRIRRALKANGFLIFDVTTRKLRATAGLQNGWQACNGGFWRPGPYLVLEQGYDYPEADVWLDQYLVIDETGCRVYRNWFHDYSRETIEPVLKKAGFTVVHWWGDLTGSEFAEDGEWIALAARKE
jgi:SAM-dependent methyltransferase